MEDVRIAKELAEAVHDGVPEPFKRDAFNILLKYRLGLQSPTIPSVQGAKAHMLPEELGFPELYRLLAPEPRTNPQRFATIAFYYREYRKQSSVNQADIVDAMHEGGLPPPKNFSRDIRVASDKRNALLMAAPDKKDNATAWQLSKTGEDFVRERLADH